MNRADIKELLDQKVEEYNRPGFIEMDPVSIPHRFARKQDVEITAFWTSILAWGQRKTIINKATELFDLMDNAPYDFIVNHQESDHKRFEEFKHRTFNGTDTLHFLSFLQQHYTEHDSLEEAFCPDGKVISVKEALVHFQEYFMSIPWAQTRTRKHIASPARKSTCKRLNMFLRWMVRKDDNGVDFGLWSELKPSQLMIPFDVHVERVARSLKLLKRKQRDWQAVEELTKTLRKFDPEDPVKYDFALFGMGAMP